jgi:hypothetical protein
MMMLKVKLLPNLVTLVEGAFKGAEVLEINAR